MIHLHHMIPANGRLNLRCNKYAVVVVRLLQNTSYDDPRPWVENSPYFIWNFTITNYIAGFFKNTKTHVSSRGYAAEKP